MRILIDIIHPADVHFFRYVIKRWQSRHEVLVTSRAKDVAVPLLDEHGVEHQTLSAQGRGFGGLARELLVRDLRLLKIARRFNPDVLTGVCGISISHVGALLRKPTVVFYDTEHASLSNRLTYPFAKIVCTPSFYGSPVPPRHLRYRGLHALSYLHPDLFTPDRKLVESALGSGSYSILRLVAWRAAHDLRERRLSFEQKKQLLELLQKRGRVFVSSEERLPDDLARYAMPLPPSAFHHALAFADLVVGDSSTVSSEAAVLGTPAIFISASSRGYTNELQSRYHLVECIDPGRFEYILERVSALFRESTFSEGHRRLLSETIRVDTFVERFVELFPIDPERAKLLAEDPMRV